MPADAIIAPPTEVTHAPQRMPISAPGDADDTAAPTAPTLDPAISATAAAAQLGNHPNQADLDATHHDITTATTTSSGAIGHVRNARPTGPLRVKPSRSMRSTISKLPLSFDPDRTHGPNMPTNITTPATVVTTAIHRHPVRGWRRIRASV
jgi:hypothetical protein